MRDIPTALAAIVFVGAMLSACGTDDTCADGTCADNNVQNNVTPDDTDGDGIRNVNEATYGTDPSNPDTDGDGRLDGTELELGLDPTAMDAACIVDAYSADLATKPVDIIFVIDNSSSMRDEIDAVETNINTNFAAVMLGAGLDFRVIMVSQHGDSEGIDAEVCVTSPLSGTNCTPVPEQPVNSARFFHYDTRVSSDDSFSKILSTYNRPDPHGFAPNGWSGWLRDDAFKVFIEITDDQQSSPSAAEFEAQLLALEPKQFGTPGNRNYIFHSIVGLYGKEDAPNEPYTADEPVSSFQCGTSESPGTEYQKLSVVTGGLRYPVCNFASYEAVFRAAAVKTIEDANIDCSLTLPSAPSGQLTDTARMVLELTDDSGRTRVVRHVESRADCVGDGFYLTEATVELCPATCAIAEGVDKGKLDVLAMCLPQSCENPSIEICEDGIDNDCDGFADRRDIKCYN